MDIETLLRESDPVLKVDVPGPDSVVGQHIRRQMALRPPVSPGRVGLRPRPRWARRLPVAAAAVGAATVVVVTLVPGAVGPSPSAAASTLSRLASRAVAVGPTVLRPGQYAYTETEDQAYVISTGDPSTGGSFDEYLSGTVQTWVAADGSGRRVVTVDPTPRFYTSADRQAWVAAGRPPAAVPPSELTTVEDFGAGSDGEVNGPVPLYDVSDLPASPAALADVLGRRQAGQTTLGALPTGLSALDTISQCTTETCAVFGRAVALLQGPDIGSTPALRSALYRVLATVAGVRLLGTTTDQAGQKGLGLELVERQPAGTYTETCGGPARSTVGNGGVISVTPTATHPSWPPVTYRSHYGASSITFTVVVDPATTALLSSGESFRPTVRAIPRNPCLAPGTSPATTRVNPSWTIERASGIVNSDTAVPGGSPSS